MNKSPDKIKVPNLNNLKIKNSLKKAFIDQFESVCERGRNKISDLKMVI